MRTISPALHFAPELLLAAQGIRVAFFDVDGVLTDGGLYFSEHGESLKRFSTLDGHGLKLLKMAGITPAVITGRDSRPLRMRLEALGIGHVSFGTEDKKPAAQAILDELGVGWEAAAAMGDDWPDLSVMQCCAFASAPAGAMPKPERWRITSRGLQAVLVPRGNSVTCFWWPGDTMPPCLSRQPGIRDEETVSAPLLGSAEHLSADLAHEPVCDGHLLARPQHTGRD